MKSTAGACGSRSRPLRNDPFPCIPLSGPRVRHAKFVPFPAVNHLIVNSADIRGGAAIAARRLHDGLRRAGVNSRMLVRYRYVEDGDTAALDTAKPEPWLEDFELDLRSLMRSPLSSTIFSLELAGQPVENHEWMEWADVINLHWTTRQMSAESLSAVLSLGKPVVLTLHDQRFFTGGCHYTAGCEGYLGDCRECPQLRPEYALLAEHSHDLSRTVFESAPRPPVVVTPSRWLGREASRSSLLGHCRVEVIPNSLDLEVFRTGGRSEARADFGIPESATVFLLGAQYLDDERKGCDLFLDAFRKAMETPEVARRVESGDVRFAVFGEGSEDLEKAGLPLAALGKLEPGADAARAYCASDLFVCPSREDNLPNTILEAMACGVPVLGSDIGGIPDMVSDGETGWLFPLDDIALFARRIAEAITEPAKLKPMGEEGRRQAEARYDLSIQAGAYARLGEKLLAQGGSDEPAASRGTSREVADSARKLRSLASIAGKAARMERKKRAVRQHFESSISRLEERHATIENEWKSLASSRTRFFRKKDISALHTKRKVLNARIRELERSKDSIKD